MSLPCTAFRFSVLTPTPSSFAKAAAFSACFTVAITCFRENNPCFRYARSRIPPSFPVPKTANFLSESFSAIVQTLLTTRPPASTAVSRHLRVQCRPRGVTILPRRVTTLAPFLFSGDYRFSARRHSAVLPRHVSAGSKTVAVFQRHSRHRRPYARRCCPARRRYPPQRHRPLPHSRLSHALRQTVRLERRLHVRKGCGARLCRSHSRCPRPLRLRRRFLSVSKRRPGRLRHYRMGPSPTLVRRNRRHVRPFLSRRGAMARRRRESTAS